MLSNKSKLISIVIPIYNEEKNISILHAKLVAIFSQIPQYRIEIILVDDGSQDNSEVEIKKIIQKDAGVRSIFFSRNFGHQIALTAGYDMAMGEAVISMDADMQDPPEIILEMLRKWEEGCDIVYARRKNRSDGLLKKITAKAYYALLDSVSEVKIPRNVGDFRLIDKRVLQEIKKCREKFRYLRGMVAWIGFRDCFVDFDRPNRVNGKTGYTWKKMLKFAMDGFTGFSMFPLKIASYVGLFVIVTGSGMFAYVMYDFLIKSTPYPLYKWLVIVVYIFIGVQFVLMWLIGEYIGRIHDQQKERPLYIIKEKLN
jgi:dolichol-phosphate mannosyltransferase